MDVVALQSSRTYARSLARKTNVTSAPLRPMISAVHPSPPTVTESATATLTSNFINFTAMQSESVSPLGSVLAFNSGSSYAFDRPTGGADNAGIKFGTQLTGDTVELAFRAQAGPASAVRYWIWVDGKPLTAAPVTPGLTIAAGTVFYVKLVFAAAAGYDIRVYTSRLDSSNLRIPAGQNLAKVVERPWKIACVGDSFGDTNETAGSNVLTSWGKLTCDALNAEWVHGCIGGTGYTAGTDPFGSTKRLAGITAAKPDLVLIFGGVNDRLATPATVGAAATAYYAALATALPGVPLVVAGMNPLFSTETYGTNQSLVHKAIRDAALAAPNVIAYFDCNGHASTGVAPAAYTTGASYVAGDRVLASGGVYECILDQASATAGLPQPYYFKPVSWYTGTGSTSSVNNNGNRDTCLYSDGVHPTQAGQYLFAGYLANCVVTALRKTI